MSEAASHPFPGAHQAPIHEVALPLEGAAEGRLEIHGGTARLKIRAAPGSQDLLRSRFTGAAPEIFAAGGRVTVRARFGVEDWLRTWVGYGLEEVRAFFTGGPPPPPPPPDSGPGVRGDDWFQRWFLGDAYSGELLLTDAVPWRVSLAGSRPSPGTSRAISSRATPASAAVAVLASRWRSALAVRSCWVVSLRDGVPRMRREPATR